MSTLTIKGQVTIPVGIRRALGLTSGSRVRVTQVNNEIKITPVPPENEDISAIFGILKSKHSVSLAEIRQARQDRILQRFDKSTAP